MGDKCDFCSPGFFGFPTCQECTCNPNGAKDNYCDITSGQCFCKENFAGDLCDQCQDGFFNFPTCEDCQCDMYGSTSDVCDDTGKCSCKDSYTGDKCDQCAAEFYAANNDCLGC